MATALSYTLEYKHMQRQARRHSVQVATTLYDVIGAVSDQARPGEEHLVAPAVVHLLREYGSTYLFSRPIATVRSFQPARDNTRVIL